MKDTNYILNLNNNNFPKDTRSFIDEESIKSPQDSLIGSIDLDSRPNEIISTEVPVFYNKKYIDNYIKNKK